MKHYVQTRKPQIYPQAASITNNEAQYTPELLHATIDQTHPVGNKKTFTRHKHDFYHIVLYTEGHGEYSIEGEFHPAQPGTCVLIHPGQHHDFVSRWKQSVYSEITFAYQSSQCKALCLTFEDLLSVYSGLDISLKSNIVFSVDRMHTLRNLMMRITNSLIRSDRLSEYQAQHNLTKIFNCLVEAAASSENKLFSESRFERTKSYIEEYYAEQICMDELAKMASASKGYFFREFKKLFGVTPLAHQQGIRIEAAKTFLKTTNLRCNEIAWRVGFSDVYFFHRIFKKHTSLTPIQFRKKTIFRNEEQ